LSNSLQVETIANSFNTTGQNDTKPFEVPEREFLSNLLELFESSRLSDVTLCVNDRQFSAHKVILAAHSPVFAAMFEDERNNNNRVEITGMDNEVLQEMLKFIYTGELSNLEKMAFNLIKAAVKYQLKTLEVVCEEWILSELSLTTAAEFLILADKYNAAQLKARVMDFIVAHATEVIGTKGWKTMMIKQPNLLSQASRAITIRHKPSNNLP